MRQRNDGKGYGMSGQNRQGGQGLGLGGRFAGAGGVCVCPQCGHQKPHKRGVPCVQEQCPKCGNNMTRQ